jgi:septum formation protein
MQIVLASASPRRLELLRPLGHELLVRPADVDESVRPGEQPVPYVARLSAEKAAAIDAPDLLVIAADTTVDLDGRILGKPANAAEARATLTELSGRTHFVHTGVTVRCGSEARTDVATTEVTFATLTPATIDWYVSTGEPVDKAGAYAIQGAAGAFVTRVAGSASNVVGLPLHLVVALAERVGVSLLTPVR